MNPRVETASLTISVLRIDRPPQLAFRVEVSTPEGKVFWAPDYGMPLSDHEAPQNRLAAAALELLDMSYKAMTGGTAAEVANPSDRAHSARHE